MTAISKRFGATRALRGVSLELRAGQALALIGENGAGKSTLMKVLSGAHSPDDGSMELAGRRYAPRGPHAARLAGVAMIYQELNLAPDLTVEENIMLGQEQSRWGVVDRARNAARSARRSSAWVMPICRWRRRSGGFRSACSNWWKSPARWPADAKVIVFDEPTSSLAQADVERLFQTIARLRQEGLGVIYISHFLEEIRRVCDSYTVLRDGETVASGTLAGTTEAQIVSLMVGRRNRGVVSQRAAHAGRNRAVGVRSLRRAKASQMFRSISAAAKFSAWPDWWERDGPSSSARSLRSIRCAAAACGWARSIPSPRPRPASAPGWPMSPKIANAKGWRKPARSPTTSPTAGCPRTAAGVG